MPTSADDIFLLGWKKLSKVSSWRKCRKSIKSSMLDITLNGNNLVAMITVIPVAMWTYDLGLQFLFPFRMVRAKAFSSSSSLFLELERWKSFFALDIKREKALLFFSSSHFLSMCFWAARRGQLLCFSSLVERKWSSAAIYYGDTHTAGGVAPFLILEGIL